MRNKKNADFSMQFIQLFIQLIFIDCYVLGPAPSSECFKCVLPYLNNVCNHKNPNQFHAN